MTGLLCLNLAMLWFSQAAVHKWSPKDCSCNVAGQTFSMKQNEKDGRVWFLIPHLQMVLQAGVAIICLCIKTSKQTKRSPLDIGVVERWGKRGVLKLCRVCADQRTWRDRSSRTKTGPSSDLFVDVYQSVRQTKINLCAFTHTPCRIRWSQIKMSRLFQSGG